MGAHDKDISGKKPFREKERLVGKGRSTSSDIQQRRKKVREDWIQIDALPCGSGWDDRDLGSPQILIQSLKEVYHEQ